MDAVQFKAWIIENAINLGFTDVKFAKAEEMEVESKRLREWLNLGYHGEMTYMENHFEKRVDPSLLVDGAKTVICLAYNYYTETTSVDTETPQISMYALGRDYHKVLKNKLKQLFADMKRIMPDVEGRYFVDSAPVLERDWAKRSGLGWVGKNTLLIHPKRGSYFFLAELIINIELPSDNPIDDYCGTCTRCIDACPTEAIDEKGYLMDGSKCISYLTIELKGDIPEQFRGSMENYMYGCDICQQVCPWNRFSVEHNESDFRPKKELLEMTKSDWENLTKETFDELFFGSAVKRTGYEGLKRNIAFLSEEDDEF